jgi:hypothetical protein
MPEASIFPDLGTFGMKIEHKTLLVKEAEGNHT